MKTHIYHQRGAIKLVLLEGKNPYSRCKVVAGATLFEGTGCWVMTDIRLHPYRGPSPYAGDLNADELSAYIKPMDEAEAEFIKSHLREYEVLDDGAICWCTFNGIVRGHPAPEGREPPVFEGGGRAGFFTRNEILEQMKDLQGFWESFEGKPEAAKMENPHQQLSEMQMFAKVDLRREGLGIEPEETQGLVTSAPSLLKC